MEGLEETQLLQRIPTNNFGDTIMHWDDLDKGCPLALLSERGNPVYPHQACRKKLDACLKAYLTADESSRRVLRGSLFFRLSPILRRLLQRYCAGGPGCRKKCIVGDLLSDAFIAFTQYLEQFDESRNVDFLNYVTTKLSWRVYNSFSREHRHWAGEIQWDEEKDGSLEEARGAMPLQKSLITTLDLETCLSRMKPETRSLFLLHYFFGYSYRELALIRQQRDATLRKTLSRVCIGIRSEYGSSAKGREQPGFSSRKSILD